MDSPTAHADRPVPTSAGAFTLASGMPPHYTPTAKVVNCLITEGCEVKGVINHSVLFAGVTVETGAEITDAVIMPGAVIERGAVVRRAIVAENAHRRGRGGRRGNRQDRRGRPQRRDPRGGQGCRRRSG